MRALEVWQSPFHVLLKDNEILFSGDAEALLNFIAKKHSVAVRGILSPDSVSSENEEQSMAYTKSSPIVSDSSSKNERKPVKPYKPTVGDKAPGFSAVTLSRKKVTLADALVRLGNSKPLNLVFMDALCPMPHFPDCEGKLAKVNELIKADNSRQWLGVVNSYYVNEEFAQQFAEKFSLKLPLIFDQGNAIYRAYDVYASPYLIKINKQGLIESRSDVLN
jgi:peroxiredoxin